MINLSRLPPEKRTQLEAMMKENGALRGSYCGDVKPLPLPKAKP